MLLALGRLGWAQDGNMSRTKALQMRFTGRSNSMGRLNGPEQCVARGEKG